MYRRYPNGWPLDQLAPEDVTMEQLRIEVMKARKKFPGSRFLLTALMEEVGEATDEIGLTRDHLDFRKECIQVACVAIRMAEEGDALYDSTSTHRVAHIISIVGRICRDLLQGNDITALCEGLMKDAASLNEHGDKTYDCLTKEEQQA